MCLPPTLLQGLEKLRFQKGPHEALDGYVREVSQKHGVSEYLLANEVLQVIYGRGKTIQERFDLVYIIAFGTDMGFLAAINQVRFLFQSGAIQKMGYVRYVWELMRSIPRGIQILWYCRRQKKRWPLIDNWHYLHTDLNDIRHEYRIES
jgi:hypothetical protein